MGFFMKNNRSLTLLMSTLLIFSSCAPKKTGSSTNVTNNYTGTDGSTTNPITGEGGGVTGCSDGVARSGATKCYYTNLSTFVFSGPGTVGPVYWSSANNLPSHISPNQFRTDASFSVRIKPIYASGGSSIQGRSCSLNTSSNFTKLQVQVMLRRAGDGLGEVKTLTGAVNGKSNTARFTVPGGTTEPYILEVVSVLSDHRSFKNSAGKYVYGTPQSGCSTNVCDIPVNGTTSPTECVAFNLEYATDDTYDLPN
jgi:hypothetical protein